MRLRWGSQALVLGAAMVAAMVATEALAAPRGFTVEDMVNMERVGSPVLSPDATRVVYTVRSTDMGKNRGHTELWLLDLNTPAAAPRRLTQADASSTDPAWSPAGDAIYYLSSSQVWRMPVAGGAAAKVTDLPVDVDNFRLSP
ncbi:MAG: prolyl oligopeptidase family protein, partial [Massilia sp.]|nr:prolyl oligopeptidase family protein [Massilia sp.]